MKMDGEVEVQEWQASRPVRFTSSEIASRYPLDRRLGETQSRSARCGVEKNPLPLQGIEPQPSSPKSVAIPAFGEECKLLKKQNFIFCHLPVISSLLDPNILLSALFFSVYDLPLLLHVTADEDRLSSLGIKQRTIYVAADVSRPSHLAGRSVE
jgi:hypothetical protein